MVLQMYSRDESWLIDKHYLFNKSEIARGVRSKSDHKTFWKTQYPAASAIMQYAKFVGGMLDVLEVDQDVKIGQSIEKA